MTTTTRTDELENRTFTAISGEALEQEQQQAQQQANDSAKANREQEREAQLLFALKMGTAHVITGLIRAARDAIAKRLPEIRQHWTDDVVAAPGQAAVPVLERYAEGLMAMLGKHPELIMFGMACMPLGLGYMAAMDQHRQAEGRTVDVPARPVPEGGPSGQD